MDLRQPWVGAGSDEISSSMLANRFPADDVHHRVGRGVHEPLVAELANLELNMGTGSRSGGSPLLSRQANHCLS